MTWAKLDDQFFYNKKIAQIDGPAKLLYIAGLVYTANQLTDGFIPERAVKFIASTADVANCQEFASQLLDVGLWDATDEGYQIHDYLEWNPSKEQVLQTRAVRAESGHRGGLAKAANAKQNASKEPSKPLAKPKQKSAPSPSPSQSPSFTPVDDDNDAGAPVDADTAKAFTAFQNDIHLVASPIQAQEMTDVIDRLKARNALDWWHMAVKIACDNNARKWSYVKAVLENALADGRAPGTNKPRTNGHGASHTRADTRDGYNIPAGYEGLVNTDVARTVAAPDPWRDLLAEADALAVMVRETPQVKERTLRQLTRKLDGMLAALPVPYDAAVVALGERLA